MRNVFFAIFLLFIYNSTAQTFELDWKSKSNVNSHGEFTVFVPSIQSDGGYLNKQNIPSFYFQEEVDGMFSYDIHNIQTKEITKNDLGEINLNNIPTKPTYTAKTAKGGNRYTKYVNVTGLYKNDNRIYQITSFELVKNANSKD